MTTDDLARMLEACALGFPNAKRIPSGATGICGGCGRPVTEPTLAAHQAAVIAAAGWTTRRAVIEELITKAETGPTDGTHDPHAAYWLRAELDGEG